MSTIPLPLVDGHTLLIDNSSLEQFTTCPRAALYSVCRRRRTSAERVPLHFGGIMHKCLDVRYRTAPAPYEQSTVVESAMIATAGEEFVLWTPPEDEFRNYDRMVDLIHRYGQQYSFEPFNILAFPDGRPFIETPFAVPLGRIEVNADLLVQDLILQDDIYVRSGPPTLRTVPFINILWTGRIDMAYSYSGGNYIMDHKSSSIATNMAEFEIAHQFYGYVWATEQILGQPINGIVINRIVVRKPTRTGEPFSFERKLISVQRGLVDEWVTDCLHIVADFVEMVRRSYMPKHTAWCVGKFGTCQFHQVCSLDSNDQREILLGSGEYEDNTWTPLI